MSGRNLEIEEAVIWKSQERPTKVLQHLMQYPYISVVWNTYTRIGVRAAKKELERFSKGPEFNVDLKKTEQYFTTGLQFLKSVPI